MHYINRGNGPTSSRSLQRPARGKPFPGQGLGCSFLLIHREFSGRQAPSVVLRCIVLGSQLSISVLIISITTLSSKILVFLKWIETEKLKYWLTVVWKNDQKQRPFKRKIWTSVRPNFCLLLFPWRELAWEQEGLLGLNLADHLNSYALLIYAENAHNFLGFLAQNSLWCFIYWCQKTLLAFQVCYLSFQWNFSKY